MLLKSAALLLLIVASSAHWVKKEQDVPPYNADTSSWVKMERPPQSQSFTFTVALKVDEDRRSKLESLFWEVSNPVHENYGKYLSIDEITEILAVPQERVQKVREHFIGAGASSALPSPNNDMITVTSSVAAAEAALNTTLHYFTHMERSEVRILRASHHYWLPGAVAEHVSMVGELLQFPRLRLKSLQNLQGSGGWPNSCEAGGCAGLVTPAVLAQRYKLPGANASATNQASTMAVAEFQDQYFKPSDLSAFSSSCHQNVTVASVVGGNKPEAGVEAELDIEYIKSVAPDVPLTVIYLSDYSLLSWVNQISSMKDAPLVHSVSYGNDEKQQSSVQYMYTCNTAFMKAGLRGISILFASGDQGVCGRSGCGLFTHARFHPDFPAASPYITAVGGTDFAGDSIGEEMAWSASGGGFSDNFGIPTYQAQAVASYKASPDAKLPPQKLWNNTGRGYPDVAALGGQKAPYCVATSGVFSGVAGTSASCPVVAGVFAKLNGLRAAAGKPPMGFLNPFIYQNPSGFQDVTSGTNGGGRVYGFNAVKGWDPATGFGTPDFEALSSLAMGRAEVSDHTIVV